MSSSLAISLLVASVIWLATLFIVPRIGRGRTGLAALPGPLHTRYTSAVLKWHVLAGTRSRYIHSLHLIYGDVVRVAPDEISIADETVRRRVYAGRDFAKAGWYARLIGSSLASRSAATAGEGLRGHQVGGEGLRGRHEKGGGIAEEYEDGNPAGGLFTVLDGREHARRRRLFAPVMSRTEIVTRWEGRVKELVNVFVSRLKRDMQTRKDKKADLLKWASFLATDVVSELAFGQDLGMLQAGEKPQYIKDLAVLLIIGGIRAEFFTLVTFLESLPFFSWLGAIYDRMQAQGRMAVEHTLSASATKHTIFSRILSHVEGGQAELSEDQISAEATNLLIAGSDTSSTALTYLIWNILRHEAIRSELLLEIHSSACPANPTLKDLEALPYLSAVVNESLRLYASVPATLPRVVPATCTGFSSVIAGYSLPAGTIVGAQAHTVNRNPKVFQDPDDFLPERWMQDLATTAAMRDSIMTWGAGARTCLGQHLARMELYHATVALFRACPDLKLAAAYATNPNLMEPDEHFVIKPKSGKCEVTIS